ncbi:MAG: glycoside hydrolase family 31 protein [Ruminococcus sp.]|nr:glycoside hydrolase family 31 protein [Ruminococcus sp.]
MDYSYGKNPNSAADPKALVTGEKYRITVLTERMVRIEYSPNGEFINQQTQTILDRRFPVPEYRVSESETEIIVTTENLIVTYEKNKPFSSTTLNIQMVGNPYLRKSGTWFYGDKGLESMGNLKGTASTLDNAVGDTYYRDSKDETKVWGEPDRPVELCEGLMSKNGFTVIDDSDSLVFDEEGWVHPAPEGHQDIYFLNYGRDYLGILDIFYHLTGKTPMLPRYALGNWWSRFHKYTQDEYLELLERFRSESIPIAVGVLDMDWHYVDIDPKYGKGWTGYTWNRELFPDPDGMMKKIHDDGMHFSLNVHPADGIRAHEEMYEDMAKALGVDYEHEAPIPFDVTSKDFMDAYFKYVHHPYEEKGVDFWWIDWQQGSNSKIPGYDPLWILNHYHYIDNARNGDRPMDFSRYAGLGSHRYPIGFSGSTFITWESLDFQPYFTANASNVGYGWWSHDIGGHRNGYRDDELTTRWVQFGVFSPIMRLHSSDEVFTGKEPWKFCADSERVMRQFLSLRHQLIPYTYTMNHRFYAENIPLVEPVYYEYPGVEDAYRYRNEYFFGSQLLVSPITEKSDPQTKTGAVKTWLPEGTWYDIFTGTVYHGDRTIRMHRSIDSIPVLCRAGGILPLESKETVSSRTDNPKKLVIKIFCGADGEFDMYEDDGISMDYTEGKSVTTRMTLDWTNKLFVVAPAKGDAKLIPGTRDYTLEFYGVGQDAVPGADYDEERHVATLSVNSVKSSEGFKVVLNPEAETTGNNISSLAYSAINRAQIPFASKEKLYRIITGNQDKLCKLSSVEAMVLPEEMKSEIREILLAW